MWWFEKELYAHVENARAIGTPFHPQDLSWKICATVKSRYIGDGHHTFNRNPYNRYINPYYWVDDHPLLDGNNGSLDPGTFVFFSDFLDCFVMGEFGSWFFGCHT